MNTTEPTPDPSATDAQPASASKAASAGDEFLRAQRERDEYLAQWKRAQADYQNLKRRAAADFEAQLRHDKKRLLSDLLLVLDSLQMALGAPAASDEAKALAAGVKLTQDQLLAALDKEELRAIPEQERFDPALHEAVAQTPDAGAAGRVLQTLRRGYTWKGAVLRAAQVRVSCALAEDDSIQD
jgi:molecular chaperone GrpE